MCVYIPRHGMEDVYISTVLDIILQSIIEGVCIYRNNILQVFETVAMQILRKQIEVRLVDQRNVV